MTFKNNRWAARIVVDKHEIHLGYYESPIAAAVAYNHAAAQYFGEFAAFNEIPGWVDIHPSPHKKHVRSENVSPYPGVAYNKFHQRWYVRVLIDGKRKYMGEYRDVEEAIKAAKSAERKSRE